MGSSKPEQDDMDVEEASKAKASAAAASPSSSTGDETPKTKESKKSIQQSASAPPQSSTPTPGGGIDAHPYARASVIEVLHGVQEENEDHWLTSSSSDEEDDDATDDGRAGSSGEAPTTRAHHPHGTSVRLCDVIDRVAVGDKYRYYVHYRDFNRRMDEWIGMERIVSPPSIGNAKARSIKKEEERQKRKQARLEERNAELATTAATMNAPRSSRRRSIVTTPSIENNTPAAAGSGLTDDDAVGSASAVGATAELPTDAVASPDLTTPRMTRRRKAENESTEKAAPSPSDASTPPAGNSAQDDDATKEVLTIATHAAEETVVGEHVVATVPAQEMDEHEGLDEASLREHEEVTKVKNVSFLELGPYRMETWYFSPLPKELLSEKGFIEILYCCEFSLHLFSRKSELLRFQARELPKNQRHPPGNEIYRSGNLSMFEVDGFEERIYCQNLCYIAKLFLDHKTLYFDVDPFLFYVLCEVDNRGYHPVGYFSKEKYSDVGYNLACILTFPSQQRKGYGRFLIAFSYELSKKEEKVGSPEKPMSDLGQQAYKPYWMSTIVDFLYNHSEGVNTMSIMDISKKTSIMAEDIVFTLNQLGILKIINGVYFIAAEQSLLERLVKKHPVKEPRVDASKLHWTPFVTDIKRDKFSIHSKKPSVEGEESRGAGGF